MEGGGGGGGDEHTLLFHARLYIANVILLEECGREAILSMAGFPPETSPSLDAPRIF